MSARTQTPAETSGRGDRFARNGHDVGEMDREAGADRRHRFARNGAGRRLGMVPVRRLLAVPALAGGALLAAAASAVAKGTTTTAATAVVNPGTGIAPPGSQQLTTILSYLAWGVTATCVAGVLIVASKMAIGTHTGRTGGGEHAGALMAVLVAAVVAGSASALVGALI